MSLRVRFLTIRRRRFGDLDRIGIVRRERKPRHHGVHAFGPPTAGTRHTLNHGEGPLPKERVERDEEDLVRLYLTDIGQYPLLTKDDEVRLAQAIEAGNLAQTELDASGKDITPARKRW